MNYDLKTLAGRLCYAMLAQDVRIAELAQALDVHPVTVGDWRKRGVNRRYKSDAVARALRIDPEWLFTGKGKQPVLVVDPAQPTKEHLAATVQRLSENVERLVQRVATLERAVGAPITVAPHSNGEDQPRRVHHI